MKCKKKIAEGNIMSREQDKLNYIKNLILMMCCDGEVAEREKKFLGRAAKAIEMKVDDWGGLLKEVIGEKRTLYPIEDRERGVATLKSLVVMAKADKRVDEREKECILRFAKSVGVSNSEWKAIKKQIDVESLFGAFKRIGPMDGAGITVLKEDFEAIDDFADVARENEVATRIVGFDEFIAGEKGEGEIVCFHACQDRAATVRRCGELLEQCGERTVSVLTRYQGHQVKYMLEIGLGKCVIEPVYSHDIEGLFSGKK